MLLDKAGDGDLSILMTWFLNEQAAMEWGGPGLRYPFDEASFREDVRLHELDSFVYRDDVGKLAGFGQVYEKLGRGHLARVVVSPALRGRGIGSSLVRDLCAKATELFNLTEHSLFVLRSNHSALRCYEAMGFEESPYPEDDDAIDGVIFMVKSSH